MAALASGAVQGVVLNTPFTEQAQTQGANVLIDMRDLNIEMLSLNVATTREQIEQDPDLLRRFVMGYVDGIQFARDRPDDAITALMNGTRTDSRAAAENAYTINRDAWSPRMSLKGVQAILDSTDHPDARTTQATDLIDDRFLRELTTAGSPPTTRGPEQMASLSGPPVTLAHVATSGGGMRGLGGWATDWCG